MYVQIKIKIFKIIEMSIHMLMSIHISIDTLSSIKSLDTVGFLARIKYQILFFIFINHICYINCLNYALVVKHTYTYCSIRISLEISQISSCDL